MNKKNYNFLTFVVDQMSSFSLGCNANPDVKTPNIDKLAKEGCNFKRAYCNNPVCMPSRATLLTGLTPRQHGCTTNGVKLPENIPTITKILAQNGYKTHSVGKLHLQPGGTDNQLENDFSWENRAMWMNGSIKKLPHMYYGFESSELVDGHVSYVYGDYSNWLNENYIGTYEKYDNKNSYYSLKGINSWRMNVPTELHYNNWIADKSIEFLNSIPANEKFFLWCSFPDPHEPFSACKPYSEMYNPESVTLNHTWNYKKDSISCLQYRREQFNHLNHSENSIREITAQTYGMITHIDNSIGRVMDCLKKRGLEDDTIVIFMSDHGEYLGSHHLIGKAEWQYEEMIRIPFIWKLPKSEEKCKKSDDIVSLLDFVPTILDFAGLDQKIMDFRGNSKADRKILPGESLKDYILDDLALNNKNAIIEYDEDWHSGYCFRVRTIVEEQYKLSIYGVNDEGTLFDLENDPYETINLWNDDNYMQIKCSLIGKLLNQLILTDRMDQTRICGA